MKPPEPGEDASKKVNGETHNAFPVVSTICWRETPLVCNSSGFTNTCSCRSRLPQIATWATPGTPIKRGAMVQRASTDMSIRDRSLEESPTIMNRLAEDNGWIIVGGL